MRKEIKLPRQFKVFAQNSKNQEKKFKYKQGTV